MKEGRTQIGKNIRIGKKCSSAWALSLCGDKTNFQTLQRCQFLNWSLLWTSAMVILGNDWKNAIPRSMRQVPLAMNTIPRVVRQVLLLHPWESSPTVNQGPDDVITSLTLLGLVLVWSQRNYQRLSKIMRYSEVQTCCPCDLPRLEVGVKMNDY